MLNLPQELIVKKKAKPSNYLRQLHHILMSEYGWIPFEEFKELKIPTVIGLFSEICQQHEAEMEEIEKTKKHGKWQT